MKTVCVLFILCLSAMCSAQSVFTYTHYNNPCQLLIRPDSTTLRIQQSKNRALYIESSGRIKKLSDSLYQITDTASFSMSVMENDTNEYSQFGVYVDSSFGQFPDIKPLHIKYYDGTTAVLNPSKGKFINYYFDRSKFNKQHPRINIETKHINPITKKAVFLTLFLRTSIDFSSEYTESFHLVISSTTIHNFGEPVFGEIHTANAR